MPIYTYLKNDGTKIEKLFKINNAPDEIILQNGDIAKKIVTTCMVGYVIHNEKQQDEQKRDEQQRQHMMDYNVQFFNPLKGQTKEQARKDFQQIKNQLSQQMLQKRQIRKQQRKQKQQKNKRTFKQNQKLYFKRKQKLADIKFEQNKLSI